jgi:hypothetical protein
VLWGGFFAAWAQRESEAVYEKFSEPFLFPTSIAAKNPQTIKPVEPLSLRYSQQIQDNGAIRFLWRFPSPAAVRFLTLYTLDGQVVARFHLPCDKGMRVVGNDETKCSEGIMIAVLSSLRFRTVKKIVYVGK